MSEKVVPIRKTFVEDYGDFQEKHTETRYIVVDEETGEVLDDAQGYGYKSAANAHRGYSYHKKPKKQQNAIKKSKKNAKKWLEKHPEVADSADDMFLRAEKDDIKVTKRDFESMLEEFGVLDSAPVDDLWNLLK